MIARLPVGTGPADPTFALASLIVNALEGKKAKGSGTFQLSAEYFLKWF